METWTSRDGLPARDIEAITQTPEGYLWIATQAGLLRFNGATFQRFDSHNTPGLKREMIRSLCVSRSGELWVGTDGGGFGTFREGKFTPHPASDSSTWGAQLAIYEARNGAMWVGGNGNTSLLKLEQRRPTHFFQFKTDIAGFAEDREGNLWVIGSEPRLACIRPDGKVISYHDRPELPTVRYTSILATQDGDLWIGTENRGVLRLHKNQFAQYHLAQGLRSEEINTLYEDRNANLWVGTKNGIHHWNGSRFVPFSRAEGLPSGDVRCIFEDREGNLWLGTGKSLTRFNNTRFTPFEFGTGDDIVVNEIVNARDGGVWAATKRGLFYTNGGLSTRYTRSEGLVNDNIVSVCEGLDRVVYALCEGGQVCKRVGGRFVPVPGLVGNWRIGADRDGLVISCNPGKLWRYREGKLFPLIMPFESCYFFTFYQDFSGVLWTACERGIGRIEGNKLEVFSDGLPFGSHVLGLVQDPQGGMWATTDHGLARFQNGSMKMYTSKQGLPEDNLYQILQDDTGKLWIGCNKGILEIEREEFAKLDHQAKSLINYTLHDASHGVRHIPNQFGAVKRANGELWFHGERGITVINPTQDVVNSAIPETRLELIRVNRELVPVVGSIDIAAGKGDWEFDYAGLSYTAPEKMKFRYRLEGFDKDWVDAGDRRSAFYTNLPPRDYLFLVKACNEDGICSLKPSLLSIHYAPFFYQTWWFRTTLVILFVGGGLAFLRWRIWRLRCRNRLLETKIAERTAELHKSNLELREIQEALEGMNAELEASNDELEATNTELAGANERLARLATTDGLTGLANHRTFQERLRQELALTERIGCSLTLLLIDVDHFKQYNDAYGHPAGDMVLRQLGALLKEHTREMDVVARYGGEEFAIIMPHTDYLGGSEAAERIREVIEKYTFPNRAITLSIGAIVVSGSIPIAEEVVRATDQALYAAKRAGRNRVLFAHEQSHKQVA